MVNAHRHCSYHSLSIPAPKCTALVISAPDFVPTSSSLPPRLPFTTAWVDSVRKLRQTTPELYSLTRERLVELLHLPQPNEELMRALVVSTSEERAGYHSWIPTDGLSVVWNQQYSLLVRSGITMTWAGTRQSITSPSCL